jgi:hypothetical protein
VIGTLHGVFLAYLALLLAWNAVASAPAADSGRNWERPVLLPLQLLLTTVLAHDALASGAFWLTRPAVAALFPLTFALALGQNVHAIVKRGARLSDIPFVLANAGLLLCTAIGTISLTGAPIPIRAAALLHDHSILQHLLGNPLAHMASLSWHVPMLVRRGQPAGIPGVLAGLFMTSLAGFLVALLAVMQDTAAEIVMRFEIEPDATAVRADLQTGILDGRSADERTAHGTERTPPGSLEARVVPADGASPLADRDGRPLLLELRAPDAWRWSLPDRDAVTQCFLDGAARLAAAEHPAVLLPFPEPDGAATLVVGDLPPAAWRHLYEEAAARVAAVSPGTRIAVRLHGTGDHSRELFLALAAAPSPIAIAGPRLQPGNAAARGPTAADTALDTWSAWRAGLTSPPELWVLAAGISPLAYGERAQSRFAEGCLARANTRPDVRAIVFEGWTDSGHTLGLLRADGEPRAAGRRLLELLPAAPSRAPSTPSRAPAAPSPAAPR